ncbi:MAG: sigma-70 family RNA polymerase sigma factor [Calditrichaeota bacterium]|nr:sigma-70 family RNA polymerase sigma factor [Calditrichota bacterium]HQU72747.1 ECF-type sigma factor [Calditrichia bacterium]
MVEPDKREFTQLLLALRDGNQAALAEITPLIYHELRRLASHYLRQESKNRTIFTTDLVHEAYLRLIDQNYASIENRAHFFGAAARLMRQILVGKARERNAQKRGGGELKLSLDEGAVLSGQKTDELLALDEALDRLKTLDERMSRIVEMRYFTGLTIDETSQALGISTATVKREWSTARAWLATELSH